MNIRQSGKNARGPVARLMTYNEVENELGENPMIGTFLTDDDVHILRIVSLTLNFDYTFEKILDGQVQQSQARPISALLSQPQAQGMAPQVPAQTSPDETGGHLRNRYSRELKPVK